MLEQRAKAASSTAKSKRSKKKLLALGGAWKDVDTETMKREIYRWRHESPAGKPAEL